MFHVFSITAPNSSVPHSFAIMPGALPQNTRYKDVVDVVASFTTMTEALNHQRDMVKIYGLEDRHPASSTWVECIETGVRYETAEKAAQAVGGTNSAMSHHLRGHAHSKSVRGFTFRRVPR